MPPDVQVIWDDEPDQNVDHVAEHGLTPDEVDEVLLDPDIPIETSRRPPHNPAKFGITTTGKHIFVVWEVVHRDPLTIYPLTAYEVSPEGDSY